MWLPSSIIKCQCFKRNLILCFSMLLFVALVTPLDIPLSPGFGELGSISQCLR